MNRLDATKYRISEPEGSAIKIIQFEAYREKRFKKNKQSLNNLQGRSSKLTITIGVQRGERKQGWKNIWRNINRNVSKFDLDKQKKNNMLESTANPKLDKCEENHSKGQIGRNPWSKEADEHITPSHKGDQPHGVQLTHHREQCAPAGNGVTLEFYAQQNFPQNKNKVDACR